MAYCFNYGNCFWGELTYLILLIGNDRGAWVAQLVEHLTLGFPSGHDLTVHEFELSVKLCADSAESAWDSVSPSLSASLHSRSLSLSQNK